MERTVYFVLTFLEAAVGVFGIRVYEMPRYTVVRQLDDGVEIRRYGARSAAETTVAGPDRQHAAEEAFSRLFRYITGANASSQTIAMTAPVQQGPAQVPTAPRSEMIAMTAPVQMQQGPDGSMMMRFFLPRAVERAGAPQPADAAVRVVSVPPETIAAQRFSGALSEEAARLHTGRLLATLQKAGIPTAGTPFVLGYDAPFTIPIFRRNEVAVAVTPSGG